jgi:hypothetical protein
VWDDTFIPGATLQVEAWVELQHGGVEILLPDTPVKLEQVGAGVIYDIVGRLLTQDGEELQVDSVLPMRVDLDWAERFGPPPALRVGTSYGSAVRSRSSWRVAPQGRGGGWSRSVRPAPPAPGPLIRESSGDGLAHAR